MPDSPSLSPSLSALRTRMQWHQQRQGVLAENVANADTRGYQARDVAAPQAAAPRGLAASRLTALRPASAGPATTDARHMTLDSGPGGVGKPRAQRGFETRPSGNAVSLEDEMMKVAQNQQDFQLAASLYQRGLGLLRTASGRR